VYAASGEPDAAHWQVEEVRALEPDYKVDLEYGLPIRDPQYRRRFLADLEKAGLTHR
jgi:hypothetical protein